MSQSESIDINTSGSLTERKYISLKNCRTNVCVGFVALFLTEFKKGKVTLQHDFFHMNFTFVI